MRRIKIASLYAFCALFSTVAISAHADPYADDLAKCLVSATTPAQRTVFIQWLFATMALHPSVAPMAKISDAKRDALDKKTGELFTKLITVSCKKQAHQATLLDGSAALQSAFSILGRSAMMGLMSDPSVTKGLNDMAKYMDAKKIEQTLAAQPPAPSSSTGSH